MSRLTTCPVLGYTTYGFAPTGKRVKVTGMSFDRLVDGQIMEGWDNWDGLGLLEQMGANVGQ